MDEHDKIFVYIWSNKESVTKKPLPDKTTFDQKETQAIKQKSPISVLEAIQMSCSHISQIDNILKIIGPTRSGVMFGSNDDTKTLFFATSQMNTKETTSTITIIKGHEWIKGQLARFLSSNSQQIKWTLTKKSTELPEKC